MLYIWDAAPILSVEALEAHRGEPVSSVTVRDALLDSSQPDEEMDREAQDSS